MSRQTDGWTDSLSRKQPGHERGADGARGRAVASRTRGPASGAPACSLYPDGSRGGLSSEPQPRKLEEACQSVGRGPLKRLPST